MQRRALLAGFYGPAFHLGNTTPNIYHAVAAAEMPAYFECRATAAVLEVRQFEGNQHKAMELEGLLITQGMNIVGRHGLTFLLGFNSLAERAVLWDKLTVDNRWGKLRGSFTTSELSVYRRG